MSPRPQDMGPADLAPNTVPPEYVDVEQARIGERNWFFNSLPLEAKERFLEVLVAARERGLDDDAAWYEAVRAAETTYPPDPELEAAAPSRFDEDEVNDETFRQDSSLPPPGP